MKEASEFFTGRERERERGGYCSEQVLNPAAPPFAPKPQSNRPLQNEPMFDELLTGPFSYTTTMPEGRPANVVCCIDRDETYFQEMTRLERSIIFNSGGQDVTVDQVASYAARSGVVMEKDIQVSAMAKARHLIHLPPGLAPETFIRATPPDLWDLGFSFQPWCPIEEASVKVPAYKVLIHVVDVPLQLWREQEIIKAVSQFGLYLGSVTPQDPNDISYWAAVVATDELERIPHSVSIVAGGFEYVIPIAPVTWKRSSIYKHSDLPKQAAPIPRPTHPAGDSSTIPPHAVKKTKT